MDCRRNWRMVRTPMGYCLEMNASEYTRHQCWAIIVCVILTTETSTCSTKHDSTHSTDRTTRNQNEKLPDKLRTLGFTMGFNSRYGGWAWKNKRKLTRSDTTYGWNGYMNGLTIYYMHPAEKYQGNLGKLNLFRDSINCYRNFLSKIDFVENPFSRKNKAKVNFRL